MKKIYETRIKKSVSIILSAAMSLSIFTAIPVSADVGKTTYSYDGYDVEYNVAGEWGDTQNIESYSCRGLRG